MITTPTEALATYLNVDLLDLKDYRYQPSRTTKPIFTYGDDYLCAIKGKQKLPQSTQPNSDEWFWEEIKSPYINGYGYSIYRRLTEDEIYERGLAD